jgi:hypothetical protein
VTTGTLNSLMLFQMSGSMALISGIQFNSLDKTDSNMAIKKWQNIIKLETEKG